MAKKDKQETEEGTDLTVRGNLAPQAYDYGEDAGAGLDGISQDEMLLPFLSILQALSPQVDEDGPAYVQGAKKGMIINSVTEELYPGDPGVLFLPVHREHRFVEWVPRDQGGGFVASHEPTDPMIIEARKGGGFGKLESPEGNDIVETFYVFGLVVDEDGLGIPAVVSFSSSNIKAYKRWVTQMRNIMIRTPDGRSIRPPMFAHTYRLRTRQQQNEKGTWYSWLVSFSEPADPANGVSAAEASRLPVDDPLYLMAKEIRDVVTSDAARMAYDTVAQEGGASGDGEDEDVF